MRHQQEKVVEKGWDDEFETYDEWARFGPLPRTGAPFFSMLTVDVVSLNRISIGHGTAEHFR